VPVEKIEQAVAENFSFGVADIIETLALRKPIFRRTAAYGHFGREDQGFAWECLDKKEALAGWLRK
jgi:S-adenosylmethionine synthetase